MQRRTLERKTAEFADREPAHRQRHRLAEDANVALTSRARDPVLGDNSAALLAAQTPALTGRVAAGDVATAPVGVAR